MLTLETSTSLSYAYALLIAIPPHDDIIKPDTITLTENYTEQ